MMKKNMGTLDRGLRAVVAVVIAILFFTHVIEGAVGIGLLVLAGIFLATSLVSFCPLYTLFGMSTCPANTDN